MKNTIPVCANGLPFSPAAERNKSAILEKLQLVLQGSEKILEIGAGTGQHAVHFCQAMHGLQWFPSDLPERISVSNAVISTFGMKNISKAIALDVQQSVWPEISIDVIYTANTAHIMSWEVTQKMLVGAAQLLPENGLLIIYGPFKYAGDFTSESNQMFDASLKRSSPDQGIRDFEAIDRIANKHQLKILHDFEMPANNRMLVYKKGL